VRLCVLVGQMVESDGSEEAAEAVENLLESYFMQIDGTYDRLVSICSFPLLVLVALLHELHCNLTASTTKSSPYLNTAPWLGCLRVCPSSMTALSPYVISAPCFGCLGVCPSLQTDRSVLRHVHASYARLVQVVSPLYS